jgi:hypothetical protein
MAERNCDSCGKRRNVSGATTCEKGHFICSVCHSGRSTCPLCGKRLKK